ncbi:cupin domain-containing protein [Caballeronia sp. LP006]|uniref:cupin domain-containing protein n=1 Tax=unclassified Caballeronia TaxID=2646786 RepID=UPI0020293150|nr:MULTISPECIES: cupin domain-containing protein [unclassified Caballeronia]MDR5774649.1 cupin domain-containing protein [Caballeronia sp. LZ002]MDR5828111.1 cupin domain-containing protein [Caballeronia sp. LP006]MDR5850085.1 cupin domain-containing protein [Caballeronia sp. LZ003]
MKVQQIKQSIGLQGLEDWGTAGLPGTPQVRVSGVQRVIPGSENIDTGVFECTPGTYRRSVKEAEVMHFLAGSGRFTPDGEDTVHFTGGDTLFFAANTEGTWEVEETMRKVYVIFQ